MVKKILLTTSVALLFSACATNQTDSAKTQDKFSIEQQEANKCQVIKEMKSKVGCYNKILETNSFAQLRVGSFLLAQKKYGQAYGYLVKSYKNKNLFSNLPLAAMYFNGLGVKKDTKAAVGLLQQSAKVDPKAAFQLGKLYLNGSDEEQIKQGINLLRLAASKGHKFAQRELVNIYANGLLGVDKNIPEAKKWNTMLKNDKRVFSYDQL